MTDSVSNPCSSIIMPGSVLGILGGGQLGRMFALSAHAMGYQVAVLDPDPQSPAGSISEYHIQADYQDKAALQKLVDLCDAVTTEFENVPADVMQFLQHKCRVHPSANAVATAQNRIAEKQFLQQHDIATTPFIVIRSEADFAMLPEIKFPCILKTAQFGYDGKGQVVCQTVEDVKNAWKSMQVDCVLEQMVDLQREVSVVLARGFDGEIDYFPLAENSHKNGILDQTHVPANISDEIAQKVQAIAEKIATTLDYIGVLAVEFFISKRAEVLVNEMAPRPHNSGHFSMNACVASQFEQQVRTLAHLPLAKTSLLKPVTMLNLLGDLWQKGEPEWQDVLAFEDVCLHLYGKKEARVGRKMGHINIMATHPDDVAYKTRQILKILHT